MDDTRTKLMDAAEELFAEKGFAAASLRAITGRAGVNLAAVNYHFGSKEDLAREVIRRRLDPINRERLNRFTAIRERDKTPAISDVLLAFVEPPFLFRDREARAPAFIIMISRAFAEPENVMQSYFFELMGPVWQEFYDLAARALPELDREVLFWRLNFVIGAMSHAMRCMDRHPPLEGFARMQDGPSLVAMLMPFITAGVESNPLVNV